MKIIKKSAKVHLFLRQILVADTKTRLLTDTKYMLLHQLTKRHIWGATNFRATFKARISPNKWNSANKVLALKVRKIKQKGHTKFFSIYIQVWNLVTLIGFNKCFVTFVQDSNQEYFTQNCWNISTCENKPTKSFNPKVYFRFEIGQNYCFWKDFKISSIFVQFRSNFNQNKV